MRPLLEKMATNTKRKIYMAAFPAFNAIPNNANIALYTALGGTTANSSGGTVTAVKNTAGGAFDLTNCETGTLTLTGTPKTGVEAPDFSIPITTSAPGSGSVSWAMAASDISSAVMAQGANLQSQYSYTLVANDSTPTGVVVQQGTISISALS